MALGLLYWADQVSRHQQVWATAEKEEHEIAEGLTQWVKDFSSSRMENDRKGMSF